LQRNECHPDLPVLKAHCFCQLYNAYGGGAAGQSSTGHSWGHPRREEAAGGSSHRGLHLLLVGGARVRLGGLRRLHVLVHGGKVVQLHARQQKANQTPALHAAVRDSRTRSCSTTAAGSHRAPMCKSALESPTYLIVRRGSGTRRPGQQMRTTSGGMRWDCCCRMVCSPAAVMPCPSSPLTSGAAPGGVPGYPLLAAAAHNSGDEHAWTPPSSSSCRDAWQRGRCRMQPREVDLGLRDARVHWFCSSVRGHAS
jgi:hypothetical protein